MMHFYKIMRMAAFSAMLPLAAMALADSPRPSVTPATGNFPGPIGTVTLTFEGASNIKFSNRALNYYDPSEAVDKTGIIYFGGYEIDQKRDMYIAEIDGDKVMFTPRDTDAPAGASIDEQKTVWDIPGKYSLMIPAGAITMNIGGKQVPCPLLEFIWVISNSADPVMSPATGDVTDMSTLTISLPAGYEFAGGYIRSFLPTVYAAVNGARSGSALAKYTLPSDAVITGVDKITFVDPMTLYPREAFVPAVGKDYVVVLPMSAIRVKNLSTGEVTNALEKEVLWHYSPLPTGAPEIVGNDEAVTVSRLDGVMLLKNADKSQLESLSPGIYIVNGRKTVVK